MVTTLPQSTRQDQRREFAARQQELARSLNAAGYGVIIRQPTDKTLASIRGARSFEAAVRSHVRPIH
jgi:hypothetical protein